MGLYLRDRLRGVLLGTAVGDALGLPFEGARSAADAPLDRFSLLGRVGFVSDDTEQSALVAASLARHPGDVDAAVSAFRRALLGWFLRLPWGIGGGTLRACVRIALGLRRSGVASAGNGAAMRAAVVGVFFSAAPREERWRWSDAIASVTHVDPRAVEGARYVAEVAAHGDLHAALAAVATPSLRAALERALDLADRSAPLDEAAAAIGTTGFVECSVPFAAYVFARHRSSADPMSALRDAVCAGGDTDTNAAIVGAWTGAHRGEGAFPCALVERLAGGPFGPAHLGALADDLADAGKRAPTARYSWALALARNVALFPVVLVHALRVYAAR